MITFGSVCSGIEGASAAWHPLGWKADWLSEIENFPNAVLKHLYPDIPNFGDMLELPSLVESGLIEAPDVLVGGTPCQSFSLAGLRKGLHDARGQLTYTFVELANAIDIIRVAEGKTECVVLWENVPGVLSDKTNAFGCLLAGLAGETEPLVSPGKRWSDAGFVLGPQRTVAWRILDAQYFGVAQRRRRVFVMASARKRFDPREVLFEFEGVRRDSAPSREAGETTTHDVAPCIGASGRGFERTGDTRGQDAVVAHTLKAEGWNASEDGTGRGVPLTVSTYRDVSQCLNAGGMGRIDYETETETMIVHDVMPTMMSGSNTKAGHNARSMETKDAYIVPLAIPINMQSAIKNGEKSPNGTGIGEDGDPANTLGAADRHAVAVALRGREGGGTAELSEIPPALRASGGGGGDKVRTLTGMCVRRLTPRECERLQGFPDDYTLVPMRGKPAADGPRYKALGNSFAVPVIRWLGQRIERALS